MRDSHLSHGSSYGGCFRILPRPDFKRPNLLATIKAPPEGALEYRVFVNGQQLRALVVDRQNFFGAISFDSG